MPEEELSDAEKVIERLISEGWKEQRSGICYINGTIRTNLLRNGQVITIQQELCPDEEFLEQEWGEVDA